jgi:hypothetical protein
MCILDEVGGHQVWWDVCVFARCYECSGLEIRSLFATLFASLCVYVPIFWL